MQATLGDVIDPQTGKKRVLRKDGFINLKTTDYTEARRLAQPYLTEHFDILALTEAYRSQRPDGALIATRQYEPGTSQTLPDGSRIEADDKSFRFYPPNSTRPIEQPNPVTKFKFVPIMDDDYVDA